MLNATGTTMNQYSTEVKGDSYYGYSDGLHSLQVIYNQFVGRIRIQATLAECYTFTGNFTWVRVYMDREHVGDGSTYDSSYGSISQVILSA